MTDSMPPGITVHCTQCGAPLAADGRFCERCGTRVSPQQLPDSDPVPPPYQVPLYPGTPSGTSEELLGAAAVNETYLGNRLVYTDGGTSFDPLLNAEYRGALVGRFLATVGVWLLVSTMLFLIFALPTFLGMVDTLGSRLEDPFSVNETDTNWGESVLLAWYAIQSIFSAVLACLFWFRRIPVQLTEWMITVDGRADSARPALEHMYAIVSARHPPIQSLRVVGLNSSRHEPRHYLRLDVERFTGFVSAFGYGTDLFIGWTFWINMSPIRWLLLTLARMFRGHGLGIYGSVAYDSTKALREVMHSAVRQGVDMATGKAEPQGQGKIGNMIPIIGVDL